MARKRKPTRRSFLKGGMLAGAAAIVPQAPIPAAEEEVLTTETCGSDYMVDVIKSLGFEYVCANPGSSFRGVQESIINYGGNRNPEFITNCHEESSVAMVRDYTKWDDQPASLIHFGESAVRAYKIAMTPPMAPVVLVLDAALQEGPVESKTKLTVPRLTMPAPPQGETAAVTELARLLVAAENPVLVADRLARTPAAMRLLVELAETLQAAVIDQGARNSQLSRLGISI